MSGQVGYSYTKDVGFWVYDAETGCSYALDIRDPTKCKLLLDAEADGFKDELRMAIFRKHESP